MTANSFKERYRNHKKSFNLIRYEKETELSKYIWELKFKEKAFAINWSILKHSTPYAPGSMRCNLCNEEKLSIMKADQKTLLNKDRKSSENVATKIGSKLEIFIASACVTENHEIKQIN